MLDVYKTDGRKVYSTKISEIKMSVDLTELNPGLYFVILTSGKMKSTKKIVIE